MVRSESYFFFSFASFRSNCRRHATVPYTFWRYNEALDSCRAHDKRIPNVKGKEREKEMSIGNLFVIPSRVVA